MKSSVREQVRRRAGQRCEYCHLPETATTTPHEIDHIRAQKHGGVSTLANLAWACFYCNSFKGSNVAGYDPETDSLQPLFNPRCDVGSDHFEWSGPVLAGKTPTGRATSEVLRINLPIRIAHRRELRSPTD